MPKIVKLTRLHAILLRLAAANKNPAVQDRISAHTFAGANPMPKTVRFEDEVFFDDSQFTENCRGLNV